MGTHRILKIGLILATHCLLVTSQGYGNIEDDSASPTGNSPSQHQQISSLPQYDPDPESYAQAPAPAPFSSNLQSGPSPSVDQGQSQDFWWNNQPVFQKPAGHPGVEPSGNAAPAPAPQSNDRAPYNPPANNTPRPQPQQFKPQPQQTPSRNPYNSPGTGPGSGWNGPNSPPASNSLAQPANNFPQGAPTPECQLLNKADCHRRPSPANQVYNAPQSAQAPPQNYRPPPQSAPQPTPQRNPQPQQPPQEAQPPPGFYRPPSQQPYDSSAQNPASNQNYQPQFSPDTGASQTSSFPQNRPQPQQQQQQPYRPPAPQSQQYNRPAPQSAPQQQYQNNNYNAQPNQYYQSQPQSEQAIGQPVIGPIDDQAPFPGCPAAMLCVQDDQCNLIGVIEDNLRLSFADKAHRVALSKCSEPSTGVQGICCRDPNYKDPWPDMNGGGNSGQYQPHHHDQGNHHHDKGQQQQQAAEPQGSFRNPYAEFGDRKKKSPVLSPLRSNTAPNSSALFDNNKDNHKSKQSSTPEPEFYPCEPDESCIIHYRCANKNENVPRKKCKEDIFRNAYYCCKLSPATPQPTRRTTTTSTTTPTYEEPTIFTLATIRPLPQRRPNLNHNLNHASPTESIYKNNPFLTDTFPPEEFTEASLTSTTPTTSTSSNLISGLGLHFHSHLHSKSSQEANQIKPNPYLDIATGSIEPAIFEDIESTTKSFFSTKPSTTQTPKFTPEDLQQTTFDTPGTNSTQTAQNSAPSTTLSPLNSTTSLPENYTEVYEPPANRTREILQNFWNVDNHFNSSTQPKTGEERITSRNALPPSRVPLKEEFLEHPPPGYVFKEYDLYTPEPILPAGFFLPPKYQYGERQYPIPADFPGVDTTTPAEDVTTISPEMGNDDEEDEGRS